MSRPGEGNPGNRGGGRKSAYEEHANAAFLADFFFKEQNKKELLKKIRSGKYSVSTKMLEKALTGENPSMLAVFNKLFPEKMQISQAPDFNFEDDN